MKLSTQQKRMNEIYSLLQQDLGYIFGEQSPQDSGARNASSARPRRAGSMSESGPNGAKREFLRVSAAFLRQLGKDLGFAEVKVDTNKAGIACSGEVTLYGIWSKENGMSFEITQHSSWPASLLYREITRLTGSYSGQNQWVSLTLFKNMEYSNST